MTPLVSELHDRLVDHAGMDADVLMRMQSADDRRLHLADADLDGVAIIDERHGVQGDRLDLR